MGERMSNDTNIERVYKVELKDLSKPINPELSELEIKAPKKGMVYYAAPKESRLERIFDTVLDTVSGKNKVGKGLGQFKNFVTWIFPQTKPIDWITDEIGDLIPTNQKQDNDMNWIVNRLQEKSTWRGAIAIATGVGLTLSPDQAAAIVAFGVAAAGIFEVFFKEPQSSDA